MIRFFPSYLPPVPLIELYIVITRFTISIFGIWRPNHDLRRRPWWSDNYQSDNTYPKLFHSITSHQ